MRLELNFFAPNGVMPVDYRPYFMSYIKSALSKNFKPIFDHVYDKAEPKSKSFTFAVVFKNSKIVNDVIRFDDCRFKLLITSFDHSLILYLYNSFVKERNTKKRFNDDFEIQLKRLFLAPHPIIKQNQIRIKFLSPLLVRVHDAQDNQDRYLTYMDEGFNAQLNQITQRMLQDNKIDCPNPTIDLRPYQAKTTVVKNMGMAFCANIGEYILSGDTDILNILLKGGMGSRRGQGFGMFYVVKQSVA
ncbi:MAG: CRISPR-associated endoribonuclease Cas6 [Clostridiales bacterium]|nr:CRISPR-associated endoribonuclease Cas6 [Clostridiales bacterium]